MSGSEAAFEGEESAHIPAIPPTVSLPGNPWRAVQRRQRATTKQLFARDPVRTDDGGVGGSDATYRDGGFICADVATGRGGDHPRPEDNASILHFHNNVFFSADPGGFLDADVGDFFYAGDIGASDVSLHYAEEDGPFSAPDVTGRFGNPPRVKDNGSLLHRDDDEPFSVDHGGSIRADDDGARNVVLPCPDDDILSRDGNSDDLWSQLRFVPAATTTVSASASAVPAPTTLTKQISISDVTMLQSDGSLRRDYLLVSDYDGDRN